MMTQTRTRVHSPMVESLPVGGAVCHMPALILPNMESQNHVIKPRVQKKMAATSLLACSERVKEITGRLDGKCVPINHLHKGKSPGKTWASLSRRGSNHMTNADVETYEWPRFRDKVDNPPVQRYTGAPLDLQHVIGGGLRMSATTRSRREKMTSSPFRPVSDPLTFIGSRERHEALMSMKDPRGYKRYVLDRTSHVRRNSIRGETNILTVANDQSRNIPGVFAPFEGLGGSKNRAAAFENINIRARPAVLHKNPVSLTGVEESKDTISLGGSSPRSPTKDIRQEVLPPIPDKSSMVSGDTKFEVGSEVIVIGSRLSPDHKTPEIYGHEKESHNTPSTPSVTPEPIAVTNMSSNSLNAPVQPVRDERSLQTRMKGAYRIKTVQHDESLRVTQVAKPSESVDNIPKKVFGNITEISTSEGSNLAAAAVVSTNSEVGSRSLLKRDSDKSMKKSVQFGPDLVREVTKIEYPWYNESSSDEDGDNDNEETTKKKITTGKKATSGTTHEDEDSEEDDDDEVIEESDSPDTETDEES